MNIIPRATDCKYFITGAYYISHWILNPLRFVGLISFVLTKLSHTISLMGYTYLAFCSLWSCGSMIYRVSFAAQWSIGV